ncbi:replication factor C [uncultured virus]|nr:replication factor C [uncultured virus]
MLLKDKYSPKNNDEVYFHKEILEKLKSMSEDDSIPHTIFYGPEGSGKKTTINSFLEMIYDDQVHKTHDTIYTVTSSGNSTTEVVIKQSNYHIIIEPNNNNFDRYLIQDVVKEYARRRPLGIFTKKKPFKTVLINNIDNLSYYAQTSLRRTMEIYSTTCRFIMWSRSLSKVIDPLRSRCYSIKIQSPTTDELFNFLLYVNFKENSNLQLKDFVKILNNSNRNVKKALWFIQLKIFGQDDQITYDEIINNICQLILSRNIREVINIRELLYKIMITNFVGSQIIKDIIYKLLTSNISFESKLNIVEIAAKYEHNLIRGRREIIHLEAFVVGIMRILYLIEYKDKKTKCLQE